MSVFVANEQSDHPIDERALASLARLAMRAEGVQESEVSILLVDRTAMAGLNGRYLGATGPTDVLAFPIDEPDQPYGPPRGPNSSRSLDELDEDADDLGDEADDAEPWLLGDVVLCPSFAAEQARAAGQSLEAELELLTVHGILHLCGLDHADPEEDAAMRARTAELLATWRSRERP